jgi:hypothetical protein
MTPSGPGKIPDPDPHYVDLGMLYRFAQVEKGPPEHPEGFVPLHLAVRGHMGTGKDHDIEQFAARMGLPYYRIPLTGEVRDVTLIGSTQLHGDGKGGTESRWEDGEITRALRGPACSTCRSSTPPAPRRCSPSTACSTATPLSTCPPGRRCACAPTSGSSAP